MTPKEIFLYAVEKVTRENWDEYLDTTCGVDRTLREKVAGLLKAHSEQNPLLDELGVYICAASEHIVERPGTWIGPYRILEEIGEGGFGIVFLCEQSEPLCRRVAVKVLKPGLDSRQVVARFEAERQALAMMQHPNIAQVFGAGLAPSGRPYFAMEFVPGISLIEYFDTRQLSIRERLRIFVNLCQAVQHAHLKGIIHRDLKPTNILVAEVDGKAAVKVIDFGIAKATGSQRLTDKTLNTRAWGFIGTPAYTSPEQLALADYEVDIRSDVYSLGVILFETLTGGTPFDSKSAMLVDGKAQEPLQRNDPPRPSAWVANLPDDNRNAVEQNRNVEPDALPAVLKRELDWIVLKAMETSPSRRYQSALEMAEDLDCYLNDTPVRACPPSRVYRFKKFAIRYRIALLTSGLVATALLVGAILSLRSAQFAHAAQQRAENSLENEKRAFVQVQRSENELRHQLYASRTAEAWNALRDGDRERARQLLDSSLPIGDNADDREFTWQFADAVWNDLPKEFVGHTDEILTACVSPDGRWIVSGGRAGIVKVWSAESCREMTSWSYSSKEISSVAFSPDGMTLATSGQDSTIRLWRSDTWEEICCLRGHTRNVCSVAWSPDGSKLVSGSRDQSIRIWDIASQSVIKKFDGLKDVVRKVVWTPDGKKVFAASGTEVHYWETDNWELRGTFNEHTGGVLAMVVSPDGALLATGGYEQLVILHTLADDKLVAREKSPGVWSLTFSPDGQHLLAGTSYGGPKVWRYDRKNFRLELVRSGLVSGKTARALAFTNSSLMVATEQDMKVHLWNQRAVYGYECRSFPEECADVAPTLNLAINSKPDGTLVLRDINTGVIVKELAGHTRPVAATAVSKTNRLLATYTEDDEVLIWDLQRAELLHRLTLVDGLRLSQAVTELQFSPNEQFIAAAGQLSSATQANSARIWDVAKGSLCRDICFDAPHGARICFNATSNRVAVGAMERVAIFPLDGREHIASIETFGQIWQIQFAPDQRRVLTSGSTPGVTHWDALSGERQGRFAREGSQVECFGLSPDGQTLAVGGKDNTLSLWHYPTGQFLGTLLQHTHTIDWIRFDSDKRLIVGSRLDDGSPRGLFIFSAGK